MLRAQYLSPSALLCGLWGKNLVSGLLDLSSESRQLAGGGLAGLAPSYSPHPSPWLCCLPIKASETRFPGPSLHNCFRPSAVPLALTAGHIHCNSQNPRHHLGLFPESPQGSSPTCSTFYTRLVPVLTSSPHRHQDPDPSLSGPLITLSRLHPQPQGGLSQLIPTWLPTCPS